MESTKVRDFSGGTDLRLAVPSFLCGELHYLIQQQVQSCIRRAGQQSQIDQASAWLDEAEAWETIRLEVASHLKDAGEWVEA